LRLDPKDMVLRVGETFRVQVNADGCTAGAGCPCADSALAGVRWRSEAPETASVDSAGVVRGRRPGTVDIVIVPTPAAVWQRARVHVTVVP
jgi:hypothetical protein